MVKMKEMLGEIEWGEELAQRGQVLQLGGQGDPGVCANKAMKVQQQTTLDYTKHLGFFNNYICIIFQILTPPHA